MTLFSFFNIYFLYQIISLCFAPLNSSWYKDIHRNKKRTRQEGSEKASHTKNEHFRAGMYKWKQFKVNCEETTIFALYSRLSSPRCNVINTRQTTKREELLPRHATMNIWCKKIRIFISENQIISAGNSIHLSRFSMCK